MLFFFEKQRVQSLIRCPSTGAVDKTPSPPPLALPSASPSASRSSMPILLSAATSRKRVHEIRCRIFETMAGIVFAELSYTNDCDGWRYFCSKISLSMYEGTGCLPLLLPSEKTVLSVITSPDKNKSDHLWKPSQFSPGFLPPVPRYFFHP